MLQFVNFVVDSAKMLRRHRIPMSRVDVILQNSANIIKQRNAENQQRCKKVCRPLNFDNTPQLTFTPKPTKKVLVLWHFSDNVKNVVEAHFIVAVEF